MPGLVTGEGGEHRLGLAEQVGQLLGRRELVVRGCGCELLFRDLVLGGFEELAAVGAPEGGDHVAAEALFERVVGLEVVEEGGAEGLEFPGVLEGDDQHPAGEAVLDGVPADAGLALGGARSGGLLCVLTVCCLLTFGTHANPFPLPDGRGPVSARKTLYSQDTGGDQGFRGVKIVSGWNYGGKRSKIVVTGFLAARGSVQFARDCGRENVRPWRGRERVRQPG